MVGDRVPAPVRRAVHAAGGGIFAAYPERTDSDPRVRLSWQDTSYQEVSDYGAFYCPDGDYMAYDDGELGVIYELAERFSPSVVAVVMAHEFGHAVQFRTDDLDRDVRDDLHGTAG